MDGAHSLAAHPCLSEHNCTSVFACTLFVAILQGHPADHTFLSRCQHLPTSAAEALGGRFFMYNCFSGCTCVPWIGCKSSILPLSMFACLLRCSTEKSHEEASGNPEALFMQSPPCGWSSTYAESLLNIWWLHPHNSH